MTATQISFAEFAATARALAESEPTQKAERANFYREAFKEREKKNAFSFGLDLAESMFSLLLEHYDSNDEGNECWNVTKELASRIIGKGCEPQNLQPFCVPTTTPDQMGSDFWGGVQP